MHEAPFAKSFTVFWLGRHTKGLQYCHNVHQKGLHWHAGIHLDPQKSRVRQKFTLARRDTDTIPQNSAKLIMETSTKQRVLPPSRFQRNITDPATNTLTILSATSTGVLVGPNTPYSTISGYPGGVSIYSEQLTIRAPVSDDKPSFGCPESDLTICCTDLEVISPRRPAPISTRGSDGTDASRKHGNPGHNIRMHVANLAHNTIEELKLDARGGKGADLGADSKQAGGNGGAGGDIFIVWKPNLCKIQSILLDFRSKYRLPVKWAEEKEENADTLHDEHFVIIDLRKKLHFTKRVYHAELQDYPELLAPLDSLFDTEIAKADKPKDPESGFPLRSIYTVTVSINQTLYNIRKAIQETKNLLGARCLVNGGPGGKSRDLGLNRGLVGSDGQNGSFENLIYGFDVKIDPRQIYFVFAHPDQCAMVLEKANTYFYLGSDQNRMKAKELLEVLIERLGFVGDAFVSACERADMSFPLLKAYLKSCGSLQATQACIKRLRYIYDRSVNLYVQLTSTNVDYYGLPADWVPRIGYESFRNLMDAALVELERTEETYLKYLNESEQKTHLDKYTAATTSRIDATVKDTQDEIGELKELLYQKYSLLMSTQRKEAIMAARQEAEVSLLRLQDEVTTHFEINIKSMLNGLINVAGQGSLAMAAAPAAAIGANLAYEGFTTVPDIQGNPVPKSLLIRQMKKGSTNVGALKQEMLDLGSTKADGTLDLNTEMSTKILTETITLNATLDEFATDKFGDAGPEAKRTLKKFSDLMIARNNEMVDFNIILKTIVSRQAEIDGLVRSSTQINKNRLDSERNTAEDLNNMTKLLEKIYDNNRARVMKLLSFLQRALRYKLLTDADFLDNAWNDRSRADPGMDEAELSMTHSTLRALRDRLSDHLFDVQEKHGSDKSLFPSNFESKGIGKRYQLSPPQLQTLLSTGKVTVSILPVDAIATDHFERSSDFRGCADIRIYRVRFWLRGIRLRETTATNTPNPDGIKTNGRHNDELSRRLHTSALVTLKLTHSGTETLINASNQPFHFRHDPISVTFSYRLHPDASFDINDSASGDIVNFSSAVRGVNSIYAAPGPFADWTVSLEDLDTESLDLTGVEAGVFEFFGSYRSFNGEDGRVGR